MVIQPNLLQSVLFFANEVLKLNSKGVFRYTGEAGNKDLEKDQEYFHVIFNEIYELMLGFATSRTGDVDTAKDMCQEAFMIMWERRKDLGNIGNMKGFIMVVLKNRCRTVKKIENNHRRIEQKIFYDDISNNYREEFSAMEGEMTKIQAAIAINKGIGKLNARHAQFLKYHFYEGLTLPEIVQKMGLRPRVVYSLKMRALESLGKLITNPYI